ncbi:hypothetical protein [Kitasatospora sp. NPDC057223]|uniref:hypothetical protein n=1 Tax=Kitasatospora sp. NPDC057223 TaxID=3346055 RepID=UPI003634C4E0
MRFDDSGTWCQKCGRRWEEDVLGQDCRFPAAGPVTPFDGDPGIALCLPHGRAGAVLVGTAAVTTTWTPARRPGHRRPWVVLGDFDASWSRHEQQESTRNHQARYRDRLGLAA